MTELLITRGYPASGKTTWSRRIASEPGWARVCRDDLRAMLFDREGLLEHDQEHRVGLAEHAQVEALLKAGVSVVVDATHLRVRHARAWAELALKLGVEFTVQDFPIEVDECVHRDNARARSGGRSVGEQVIRDMGTKFPIGGWEPVTPRACEEEPAPQPYTPDGKLPDAYIFDMDGTLARMDGRGPFDRHPVGTVKPVRGVVEVAGRLAAEAKIIVMSGRDESCREITESRLFHHKIPFHKLYMRPTKDTRKDSAVKLELFDMYVRPNYAVRGAFDDRLSVCRLWHRLGIPLFRVGDPDAPEF